MSPRSILQIKVSLKGRPLKTLRFEGDEINIGRDPDSDVFLDNPGVSRRHARIARTSLGYQVTDLESANGTYLNDRPVRQNEIRDGDVLRIGKFSLWVEVAKDLRHPAPQPPRDPFPGTCEGTTVLRSDQLARIMNNIQEAEKEGPVPEKVVALHPRGVSAKSDARFILRTGTAALIFALGLLAGISGTLLFIR